MIGHCFPVWLCFRGGKVIATFLGSLLGLHGLLVLLFAVVWLGVAYTRRISSLAALNASEAVAIAAFFVHSVRRRRSAPHPRRAPRGAMPAVPHLPQYTVALRWKVYAICRAGRSVRRPRGEAEGTAAP